jgi:hypothetical protein
MGAIAQWSIAPVVHGFVAQQRWETTASGPTGAMGAAVTLTWSIVPDGTLIQGEGESNLIDFFDRAYGAGTTGGDDLTHRPWFPLVSEPLNRWSELSGLTFIYEPFDDGPTHGSADGALGVRGDVRIGGAPVDGPGGTLAYIYFPSNSDLVVDTVDASFFGNPLFGFRPFRNTLMHELGHGLGLGHVVSNTDAFLMEPAINLTIDGPQLDDIRGIQSLYGDALEKTHDGLGNGSVATATHLGSLASGAPLSVGSDAGPDTVVAPDDIDFVSIASSADRDVFAFEVSWAAGLNAVLTPRGGAFNHGIQGGTQSLMDANALNDLRLKVFASDGETVLAIADNFPAGRAEALSGVYLPSAGEYYVEVTGSLDAVQLYQLDLSLVAAATLLPGDYNRNGLVDAADYVVWRKSIASNELGLAADGNHDFIVDAADYGVWTRGVGTGSGSSTVIMQNGVPEPTSLVLLVIAAIMCAASRRKFGQLLVQRSHGDE